MPNWCDNIMYVRGADADFARIREQVFTNYEDGEENLDFNKIIAEPQYGHDMVYRSKLFNEEATGQDCWYFWRIDHWGDEMGR